MTRRRPGISLPVTSNGPTINWGTIVEDTDDPPGEMIVVNTPHKRAYEWDVYGRTLAERNPEYPMTDWVIACVYRDELRYERPYYGGQQTLSLSELSATPNLTVYFFPQSRLRVIGRVTPPMVPIEDIQPAPYHVRRFNVGENREFIQQTREEGKPLGLPLVRKVEGGFEIINGHKRVWVSAAAGLEKIPVQVLRVDDRRAADLWVKHHFEGYDDNEQEEALSRLKNQFGPGVYDELYHLSHPA